MADCSTDWLMRITHAMIERYWCRCLHSASAWPCRVNGDECVSGVCGPICESESISTMILFDSLFVFLILSVVAHLTNLFRSRYLIVAGCLRMIALGVMLLLVAHFLNS